MNVASTQLLSQQAIRDVDAAVRDVLTALRGFRVDPSTPGRNGCVAQSNDGVFTFSGRLLSLRAVESLSSSLKVVEITPGTVVTPLARDLLKRLHVEIRYSSQAALTSSRSAGDWAFAIESVSGLSDAVRRMLLEGSDAWSEVGTRIEELTKWVVDAEHRGGLFLTQEPAVAVYRACRIPDIRAAVASEPEEVARIIRSLGPNVLVVELSGCSVALVRQLAATLRRGGAPVVPPGLT